MDEQKATALATKLKGVTIADCCVAELIGYGKSAAVFEASRENETVALKIFDPELVDKFGKESQLERVRREQILKDHTHDNLVKILDGGASDEHGLIYVVMEYVQGKNLDDQISCLPRESIRPVIAQVADAARFLEELGLIHRDIKPANIVYNHESGHAVLLDLGVLRPTDNDMLEDATGEEFVATLRYSSPEYLLGGSLDTPESGRALTFYQLGAVLHDLIMRRPLFFEESKPFGRLVSAVTNTIPEIDPNAVDPDLIELAQKCLVKPDDLRLKLVAWADFAPLVSGTESCDEVIARIQKRARLKASLSRKPSTKTNEMQNQQVLFLFRDEVRSLILKICVPEDVFPPIKVTEVSADSGEARLWIHLSSSSSSLLTLSLSIVLDIRILSANPTMVGLSGFCYLSENENECAPQSMVETIYKGPFPSDSLHDVLRRYLFGALDSGSGTVSDEATPTDDPVYLRTVGAKDE